MVELTQTKRELLSMFGETDKSPHYQGRKRDILTYSLNRKEHVRNLGT